MQTKTQAPNTIVKVFKCFLALSFLVASLFLLGKQTSLRVYAQQCPPQETITVHGQRSSGGYGQYCEYGNAGASCSPGFSLEHCDEPVIPDLADHGPRSCYASCRCIGDSSQCATPPPTPTPTPTPEPSPTPAECGPVYRGGGGFTSLTWSMNVVGNKVIVTVRNRDDAAHTVPVSLSAYRMVDHVLSHQVLYDGTGEVALCPGEEKTLEVNVADCSTQVDFWNGLYPTVLDDTNPYGGAYAYPKVLMWLFDAQGQIFWGDGRLSSVPMTTIIDHFCATAPSECADTNGDHKYDACSVTGTGPVCTPNQPLPAICSCTDGYQQCGDASCIPNGACCPGTKQCNGQCIINSGCCSDADCNDNNSCTTDQCINNQCKNTESCPAGTSCDPETKTCACPAGTTLVNGQCQCKNGATNPPQCDQCKDGQVLVNGQCVDKCTNGATNPPKCDVCKDGYVLVNGQCIPDCTNGATNPPDCNICRAGQVLVDGKCIDNCKNGATNPPKCDVCKDGYVLVNGQCIPDCTNGATNPPKCDICKDGYVLVNGQCIPDCTNGATNPPKCDICKDGYVLVNNKCIPDCTNGAINPPECNVCKAGQIFVGGKCIDSCKNGATNPPKCDVCKDGYILVNGQCVPKCTNGAVNPPECNQCLKGYVYVNGQCIPDCTNGAINPPACNQCAAGYVLVNNQCIPNCTNGAINPPKCDQCLTGYVYINGQCVPNCTNGAINPPACNQCATGYVLVNNQCVLNCTNGAINPPACNQCAVGYILVNNQCIPNCTNGAINPPACNQCAAGYVLVNNQCIPNCTNGAINPPACNQCQNGYVFVNGQCVPNCTNGAINPPYCTQCINGYVLVNNQCVPNCTNGAINPPLCNRCAPGSVMENGQCIDKQCRACGCVGVESKNDNGTDAVIVGDYQPFYYLVTVDNRSSGTNPVTVSQNVQSKSKFLNNDLNQTASSTNEGAIEYPTAYATFRNIYNAGGSPIFLIAIGGQSIDPRQVTEGLTVPVNLGNDIGGKAELFTIDGLNPVCSASDVGTQNCLPTCKAGQNETTDFCSVNNGKQFSGVKVEIRAKGRTSLPPPYSFTGNTQIVQYNNQFMTSNFGRPVNNAVGRLYISKSYVQTGNAGGAFFGSAPGGLNISGLGDVNQVGGKNYSGIFSTVLQSSFGSLWSYLASIGSSSSNSNGFQASGITRGVTTSLDPSADINIYTENDFRTKLAQRPDGAQIYTYNGNGTLHMNLLSSSCINQNSTVIVQSGNLSLDSNVQYCDGSSTGSIAFVVLNGNIIINQDQGHPNSDVSRLDGIYVANSNPNTNTGLIMAPNTCPPAVPSVMQLVVNGSLYGNINQLLQCRSYVAPPGQVTLNNGSSAAVSVNYSSRILTNTPVGLRSILGDTIFRLVVR